MLLDSLCSERGYCYNNGHVGKLGWPGLEFTVFITINLEGCLSQIAGVRPAIYPTYRIAMPPSIASALPPQPPIRSSLLVVRPYSLLRLLSRSVRRVVFPLVGTARTVRSGPSEVRSELWSDSEFGLLGSDFRVGLWGWTFRSDFRGLHRYSWPGPGTQIPEDTLHTTNYVHT